MTIEQGNIVYNHILVRFGELSTKGEDKEDFIKRLLTNVKNALRDYDRLSYECTHDRLYTMLNGEDPHAVSEHLQKVFGASSFSFAIRVDSDIEAMKQTTLQVAKESDARTFKIEAHRSHKLFPMISDEINRAVTGEILRDTELKVSVRKPQLRVQIEVYQENTYIMTGRIAGAGGYPVGIGRKVLVMLSGGTDSPVVSYLTTKHGVTIECVHHASPPYTSQATQDKVLGLTRQLAPYQGHIRVHVVSFTGLQLAIYKNCDKSYATAIIHRMMYCVVRWLCEQQHCLVIVNGESIGQVAGRALESIQTINCVTTTPVTRPVVCMDKVEIINVSHAIDTYDISIQPFEDYCTIFTPKNPVTKPTIQRSERLEARFDYESLLQECIEKIEHVDVYPKVKLDEDIFQYKLKTLIRIDNAR